LVSPNRRRPAPSTDDAFGIDPDIQEMFYGDAAS
jgi:hypothetical protein